MCRGCGLSRYDKAHRTEVGGSNGIVDIVILIGIPVVRQFLGAKHKNGLVAVFVVFNNGKGGKGFTKTNTVCKNAAVELLKFVYDSKSGISLEL